MTVVPTLFIWAPFFFRIKTFWTIPLPQEGMATIVANYDGPLFLVVAKSFYNSGIIGGFEFSLPSEYYAAHFPFFPLLIRLFSFVLGFPYAMLAITVLSSFLAVFFFFKLAGLFFDRKQSLFLAFAFSIFPARWLIVRSVGSAEPLFIAAILASFYYFRSKKYLWAGLWGAVAQMTKSPGILLFAAYAAVWILPRLRELAAAKAGQWLKHLNLTQFLYLGIIPLSLIAVFTLYAFTYGNFFAYFTSGDNIHLFFPPFQIFNYSAPWVGTFWLEEVIFVYLIGFLGLIRLIKQKKADMAWFVGIFFASIIFVSHRDILRYSLPVVPFLLIAFGEVVNSREFKAALFFLLIPIYLFSLAYISQNVMPISNWAPFL